MRSLYFVLIDTLLPLLAFAMLGLFGLAGFGLLCYGAYEVFAVSWDWGLKLMGAGLLCGVLGNIVFWFLLYVAFNLHPEKEVH